MPKTDAPVDISWRADDDTDKPQVDLPPYGCNAGEVIGVCSKAARRAGWLDDERKALYAEFTAGSYDNVFAVANRYFITD